MRRQLIFVFASIALVGCTTLNKQQLPESTFPTLKGQTVAPSSRKVPDFAAMTAGKAVFALAGAVVAIAEGNKLIEDNKVADPAIGIAQDLAAALSASRGMQGVIGPVAVTTEEPGALANEVGSKAQFLVDVQTVNWNFGYFPTNWARYRVMYMAKARLIDLQSKRVIAEGYCSRVPESDAGAPSYDDLLANQASRLKQELSIAASDCVKALKAEMLAL